MQNTLQAPHVEVPAGCFGEPIEAQSVAQKRHHICDLRPEGVEIEPLRNPFVSEGIVLPYIDYLYTIETAFTVGGRRWEPDPFVSEGVRKDA
jgi:hypothetical protein